MTKGPGKDKKKTRNKNKAKTVKSNMSSERMIMMKGRRVRSRRIIFHHRPIRGGGKYLGIW